MVCIVNSVNVESTQGGWKKKDTRKYIIMIIMCVLAVAAGFQHFLGGRGLEKLYVFPTHTACQ